MIKFLADENINGHLLRGLLRVEPDLDVVRVQDTEYYGADDPQVLDFAASSHRVLLTHDFQTMIGFAYARIEQGLPMPGVIAVQRDTPLSTAIEDIWLIAVESNPAELQWQVVYIPL